MSKSAYPFTLVSAILLSAIVLTSCGGGKRGTIHIDQQSEQKSTTQNPAETEQDLQQQLNIAALVEQARFNDPYAEALDALIAIGKDPSFSPENQGLAALKHAELLFNLEHPDAFQVCERTIEQWPNHPYLPHMHNVLAEQWALIGNHESAITELTKALREPSIDPYTLTHNVEIATPLLDKVSEQSSLNWMLAVSQHDLKNQDNWLRKAARLSSLTKVLEIRRSEHPIQPQQANFYAYVARERLMVGDYHSVRVLAKILEVDFPESQATSTVKYWAESEGELTTIGIMLPLTGKYANYGQQALEGIRLAMNRPEFERNIILRIQDTAGDTSQVISAYHQLLSQGAQWIIGPLLSDNTAALIPYIVDNKPIISLSSQVQLAGQSKSLFIHSLAKTVQADFMAHYALQQGKKRIAIIYDHSNSTTAEAAAFAQTFMDNGGEIIDMMVLEEGVYDSRPDLVAMRSRTDDEVLLASLEEDLFLFSPEIEMDIKMPLNMDAIYIAASGKRIAVLAGEMAYSGIHRIQLYGSHRWDDGHLMDDKGLYLNHAKFATPVTSLRQPSQAISDVQNQYRGIWAQDTNISPLFALAYDTAMTIASLGTRLGLEGKSAILELNITSEFPAISGAFYFDGSGISQKKFAIQHIRKNKIESLQLSQ